MRRILGNQTDANDMALDASPVAQAVRDLMEERTEQWVGTATDLLSELEAVTSEQVRRQKSWPGNARTLSNASAASRAQSCGPWGSR